MTQKLHSDKIRKSTWRNYVGTQWGFSRLKFVKNGASYHFVKKLFKKYSNFSICFCDNLSSKFIIWNWITQFLQNWNFQYSKIICRLILIRKFILRLCIAYSDCETLSSDECSDCLSGQAQCESLQPKCGLKGMCVGDLIEVVNILKPNP